MRYGCRGDGAKFETRRIRACEGFQNFGRWDFQDRRGRGGDSRHVATGRTRGERKGGGRSFRHCMASHKSWMTKYIYIYTKLYGEFWISAESFPIMKLSLFNFSKLWKIRFRNMYLLLNRAKPDKPLVVSKRRSKWREGRIFR